MNMKRFMNKKVAAIGLAAGLALGAAGAAFAYFTDDRCAAPAAGRLAPTAGVGHQPGHTGATYSPTALTDNW